MLLSQFEKRQFDLQTLENGLQVLFVHIPGKRNGAVSACVNAGHFNDPPHIEGLAHLLEHMMFLGSQHYPIANGINDFLSAHGGHINAWTGTEYSNYHFDVHADFLPDALLHFVDMLTNPLIDEELVNKEINAIDAEFKMKQQDDLRRLYQVHKETCNQAHPFSQFSVGNEETLRKPPLKTVCHALRDFHHDYYHTGNIKICVMSGLPLPQLISSTRPLLEDMRKGNLKKQQELPPLYLEQNLAVKININPIKKARRLILTFAMPSLAEKYREKPTSLISHLLGDEGKGSLLSYYKEKNWATSLTAGGGISGRNFKDFNLNMQLTEEGVEHVKDIIEGVFSYIEKIKKSDSLTWRIKEKNTLYQLAFDYSEEGKLIDEVTQLAQQLFEYPEEHIVAGEFLMDQASEASLAYILNMLTPENMRIKLVAQGLDTQHLCDWYHTPYQVNSLEQDWPEAFKSPSSIAALSLPETNHYIPLGNQLQPLNQQYSLPQKILAQTNLDIWFGQDTDFSIPKGDCYVSFDCPITEQGVEIVTYKKLWAALTMERWRKLFYQAEVAGLHYHAYAHQGGFSLHTSGFSEKQLALCSTLLTKLHQPQDFKDSFTQIKDRQHQGLKNSLLNKPLNRLFTLLSVLMKRNTFIPEEMAPIMENASLEKVEQTHNALMNDYHVETLIYGNWSVEQGESFAASCKKILSPSLTGEKVSRNIVDLRHTLPYLHHTKTQGKEEAAVVYYQAPSATLTDVALTILTEQLLATPFFQQLRTEKQLGYLVGTGYSPFNQHPGMAFYVQSPNVAADELVQHIHLFLHQAQQHFTQLSTYWENLCSSIANQLVEKDSNLAMKSQRLWMALGNEDYAFNRQQALIEAVEEIEFHQVERFYQDMISQTGFGQLILLSTNKSKLDMHIPYQNIDDINRFKDAAEFMR